MRIIDTICRFLVQFLTLAMLLTGVTVVIGVLAILVSISDS